MNNITKNLLKKTPLFTLAEKRAVRLKKTILTSALSFSVLCGSIGNGLHAGGRANASNRHSSSNNPSNNRDYRQVQQQQRFGQQHQQPMQPQQPIQPQPFGQPQQLGQQQQPMMQQYDCGQIDSTTQKTSQKDVFDKGDQPTKNNQSASENLDHQLLKDIDGAIITISEFEDNEDNEKIKKEYCRYLLGKYDMKHILDAINVIRNNLPQNDQDTVDELIKRIKGAFHNTQLIKDIEDSIINMSVVSESLISDFQKINDDDPSNYKMTMQDYGKVYGQDLLGKYSMQDILDAIKIIRRHHNQDIVEELIKGIKDAYPESNEYAEIITEFKTTPINKLDPTFINHNKKNTIGDIELNEDGLRSLLRLVHLKESAEDSERTQTLWLPIANYREIQHKYGLRKNKNDNAMSLAGDLCNNVGLFNPDTDSETIKENVINVQLMLPDPHTYNARNYYAGMGYGANILRNANLSDLFRDIHEKVKEQNIGTMAYALDLHELFYLDYNEDFWKLVYGLDQNKKRTLLALLVTLNYTKDPHKNSDRLDKLSQGELGENNLNQNDLKTLIMSIIKGPNNQRTASKDNTVSINECRENPVTHLTQILSKLDLDINYHKVEFLAEYLLTHFGACLATNIDDVASADQLGELAGSIFSLKMGLKETLNLYIECLKYVKINQGETCEKRYLDKIWRALKAIANLDNNDAKNDMTKKILDKVIKWNSLTPKWSLVDYFNSPNDETLPKDSELNKLLLLRFDEHNDLSVYELIKSYLTSKEYDNDKDIGAKQYIVNFINKTMQTINENQIQSLGYIEHANVDQNTQMIFKQYDAIGKKKSYDQVQKEIEQQHITKAQVKGAVQSNRLKDQNVLNGEAYYEDYEDEYNY